MNILFYHLSTTLLIISFLLVKVIQISNTYEWTYECCDGHQQDYLTTLDALCESMKAKSQQW